MTSFIWILQVNNKWNITEDVNDALQYSATKPRSDYNKTKLIITLAYINNSPAPPPPQVLVLAINGFSVDTKIDLICIPQAPVNMFRIFSQNIESLRSPTQQSNQPFGFHTNKLTNQKIVWFHVVLGSYLIC